MPHYPLANEDCFIGHRSTDTDCFRKPYCPSWNKYKTVEDEEIFEVVRRRLFDNIGNPQVIELVLNRYKNTYHNRRSDLPNQADRMEYINKMRKSYPFHPELIDMFRLKSV